MPLPKRLIPTLAVILAFLRASLPGAEPWETGDTPAWVEPATLEAQIARPIEPALLEQVSDGIYYLLADYQYHPTLDPPASYTHAAWRILSQEGLENGSRVSIDFDPSYQRLLLHDVSVRRDGVRTERLDPAEVRLIQRERSLEYQLFDGVLSAVIFVPDVRVGDVVEYSFTVLGENPALAGHFVKHLALGWTVPLGKLRHRLLWPPDRRVHVRAHGTEHQAVRRDRGALTEYSWELEDLPATASEGSLPHWHETLPWEQLSTFESWSDVAAWAEELYDHPAPGGALDDAALRSISDSATLEERVQAVVHFVQDEVRYLGIELGAGSFRPNAPARVLARRFGDCKDKSLLLVALLRKLDVSAWPTLVSSWRGDRLSQLHPSPLAFDHVIARVRLGDRDVWIDPTLRLQGGGLFEIHVPDYQKGMPIDDELDALVKIESPRAARGRIVIRQRLEVGSSYEPAELTVTTRYHGSEADDQRRHLAESSREQLGKDYLNFYAENYPAIESSAAVEIDDDRASNVVETRESYSLPGFWTAAGAEDVWTADIEASELLSYMSLPVTTLRSQPLGIRYPLEVSETIEVRLPVEWGIDMEDATIENDFFAFRAKYRYANRRLSLHYTYRTLADAVPVGEVAEYVRDLQRAREELTFQLSSVGEPAEPAREPSLRVSSKDLNWPVAFLMLVAFLVSLQIARKLARPSPLTTTDASPPRIGGLLILVAIGVFVAPVRTLVSLPDYRGVLSLEQWSVLTHPDSSAYHPLWSPTLSIDAAFWPVILVGQSLLVVLFVRKRRLFPHVWMSLAWIVLGWELSATVLLMSIPGAGDPSETVGLVARSIVVGLWTLYLLRSRRVRATFVS